MTQTEWLTLLEAAHWAPSCFNEQPWHFIVGWESQDKALLCELLAPANQIWAQNASMLGFLLSKKHFQQNGAPNRWASLDAGAAWMSLALQAQHMGLAAHAMGGFDADRAYAALSIDQSQWTLECAFAVGELASPDRLPESLQAREAPSSRRALETMWEKPKVR
jgi:nitroreductase